MDLYPETVDTGGVFRTQEDASHKLIRTPETGDSPDTPEFPLSKVLLIRSSSMPDIRQSPELRLDSLFPAMRRSKSFVHVNYDRQRFFNSTIRSSDFMIAITNVENEKPVNTIVSYDMGWSKRGSGKQYDSLNGYGAIIGFLTGKVLDFGTRNRACKSCEVNVPKDKHDCRLNFRGSAKAMEADLAAELINNSCILEKCNIKVRVMIGDEDSSAIAAVRKLSISHIHKLADTNHLKRNFLSDLYSIRKNHRELRETKVMKHIETCFKYAIAQNQGDSVGLAATLRSIPDHLFGVHDNCGTWCTLMDGDHKVLLTSESLRRALGEIFLKFAINSSKFSIYASSQANESLNSVMSRKASKQYCYSKSEAADYRFASSVLVKNEGNLYILKDLRQLEIDPSKELSNFLVEQDCLRNNVAVKSTTREQKLKRKLMSMRREDLRKKTERCEGTRYESKCGLLIDVEVSNLQGHQSQLPSSLFDSVEPNGPNIHNESQPTDCVIVFFDVETSGFGRKAEIIQIAAVSEAESFSAFLKPTKTIHPKATAVHNLEYRNGMLFHCGSQVESRDKILVMEDFLNFLICFGKPALLVAHNATFDRMMLLKTMKTTNSLRHFQPWIIGISDTLKYFRTKFPERKGKKNQLTLATLVKDFLPAQYRNQSFHDALYDVRVLQELFYKIGYRNDLLDIMISFDESLDIENKSERQAHFVEELSPLKGKISANMIKKLASVEITLQIMEEAFKKNGSAGLKTTLSSAVLNGKPIIRKPDKIIQQLINFFTEEAGVNALAVKRVGYESHYAVGLVNNGNTCYINSVLQSLFHTKEFRENVIALRGRSNSSIVNELKNIFVKMSRLINKTFNPKKFVDLVRPTEFPEGTQQDSAEFIM